MQSLKQKLIDSIRLRGFLTNAELWQICYKEGYKPDQATRRLREIMQPTHQSYNPHIYAHRTEGIIHGYGWKETSNYPVVNQFFKDFPIKKEKVTLF